MRGNAGAARPDIAWRNKIFAAWLARQGEHVSTDAHAKAAKLRELSEQWRGMSAEEQRTACMQQGAHMAQTPAGAWEAQGDHGETQEI